MSLRVKLILALLLTSLASVGLVGVIAYMQFTHKFNNKTLHESFNRFKGDVVAYIRTYGSWDEAERQEPFRRFVVRRMAPGGGSPGPSGDRPPSFYGPPPMQRPDAGPQLPDPRTPPPFLFVLFSPSGKVLLPVPPYRMGEAVRTEDRRNAMPIRVDGRLVAYASPKGRIRLSKADRDYLIAMRRALIYGVVSAMALALLLGILFGNTLSRALRRLTQALQSMGEGALNQRVDIKSRDEVGLLARAFNRMSEDLVRSREKLEQSNRTISRQAAKLEELSMRDFLTDLYNRRHFDEQADRLFEQADRYRHPLSVMIGDIDFFKDINDRFTHAVGDAVLKAVADILRRNTRHTDLAARYGGEEFVMAFPETTLAQAAELCEKLRLWIEAYDWAAIHPDLKVTISIGVSSNKGTPSMDAMLQAADTRLYQAKQDGRNRVCSA